MASKELEMLYDLSKATEEQLKDVVFVKEALAFNIENARYVSRNVLKQVNALNKKEVIEKEKRKAQFQKAYDKILLLILDGDKYALKNAPEDIKNDRDIVWNAIVRFGITQIKYAGEQLRKDKRFMLNILQIYPEAINHTSSYLIVSPSFLQQAVKINPEVKNFIPEYFQDKNREFIDEEPENY